MTKSLFFALIISLISSISQAQAQNVIKVNKADNELYIIAVSSKSTASYQILHLKTGWWKGVDVTLNITAGTFTSGYEANAINATQTNAVDLKGSMNIKLPAGDYAILIATIDWGTKGYSSVTVNGKTYEENLDNSKPFNPIVNFKAGDEGNPIMITVK